MSTHTSTKRGHARVVPADPESLVRFAELLKLRSLARTTQEEYLRYVRKLAARVGGDPAGIDEAQLRAHLLYLKDAHHYSPLLDAFRGRGDARLLWSVPWPRLEAVRPGPLPPSALTLPSWSSPARRFPCGCSRSCARTGF